MQKTTLKCQKTDILQSKLCYNKIHDFVFWDVMGINIAIIDDNDILLDSLVALTNACVQIPHSVSAFSSVADLVAFAQKEKIDILLTDIKMPIVNGVHLSQMLHQIHPTMQTIFISNYTTYVEDAFGAAPVYYLLKPITQERLQNALDLAIRQVKQSSGTLNVLSKNIPIHIALSTIKYLESRKRYVYIFSDECLQIVAKLDDIEAEIPYGFVRCHKSYLVNMAQVKTIANYKIKLISGEIIPCAKSRYKFVKEQIIRFWGGRI